MPDYPDRPGYSFDPGPPPEASRFFRNKGISPSFSFRDVEPEEHAVAFTVAKMAKADMLAAAKAEVQRAIDEGQSFDQFKRAWRGNPALKDWWGQERQTDPLTGEDEIVQLGSPRRLRTIYRANLRSARAAGQWERIERTKDGLPFLEYRLGPSENHRQAHVARAGTILPVDDPFWAAWMPPNGWGCKCWVRQLTRRQAEARGGVSPSPAIETREVVNPRTGETKRVPLGLDPSWDRNPGQQRLRSMEALLDGKLSDAPEAEARAAMRDMASSWRVRRILNGAPGRVPVGMFPPWAADDMAAGRIVNISAASRRHLVDDKPGQDRVRHLAGLDRLSEAEEGYVEMSRDDRPAYHFLVPGGAVNARRGNDLHLVVWMEDGVPVIRTLYPTTSRAFSRKKARDQTRSFGE